MNRTDLLSILIPVSGLVVYASSLGLADQIDAIAPGWGKKTLALISLVSIVAGIIVRVLQNPTPTNTITVTDEATGRSTTVATVNPPGTITAPTPASTPKG